MRKVLTCLRCGHVRPYDNNMRDDAVRTCQEPSSQRMGYLCGGMMYHADEKSLGAWRLTTGRTRGNVQRSITKSTVYRRTMQGG